MIKMPVNKKQTINIPKITLNWSEWTSWASVALLEREGGVTIPNKISGVYEAKHAHSDECLTIGKASDLRWRVRQGLVRGKAPHSSGSLIRTNEDLTTVCVRWAITDRPAAAEEELHRLYRGKHECLPKYTKHT
jgi:hypothetical protein